MYLPYPLTDIFIKTIPTNRQYNQTHLKINKIKNQFSFQIQAENLVIFLFLFANKWKI